MEMDELFRHFGSLTYIEFYDNWYHNYCSLNDHNPDGLKVFEWTQAHGAGRTMMSVSAHHPWSVAQKDMC